MVGLFFCIKSVEIFIMKKSLLIFFSLITLTFTAYSSVFIDCYTDGDTLSDEVITNAFKFTLGGKTSKVIYTEYQMRIISFDITIYSKFGGVIFNESFTNPVFTPELKKQLYGGASEVAKIRIDNIIVKANDGSRYMDPTTFYRAKTTHKKCDEKSIYTVSFRGKILSGVNKDVPVQHQKVVVFDNKNKIVDTVITDNYGDFTLTKLYENEPYQLVFEETTTDFNEFYIAKQDGIVVDKLTKTNNQFVYELTANKIKLFNNDDDENNALKLKKFISSKEQEITLVENIYYKINSADVELSSQPTLNKIIKVLQENKNLKLVIFSHTDANGDDAYNLKLSELRAKKVHAYFVSKGISNDRLSAKGLGETQLLNRCKNGIACSDIEHKLNRRTEFKFTK